MDAANKSLHSILPELNLERDVIVDCKLGTGSTDLRDVFKPCDGKVRRANDTSFGVGHGPFSETETIVRAVSDFHRYRPAPEVSGIRPGYQDYGVAGRQYHHPDHRLCHG